uniref:Uncharacterized protein n=1 Tax=Arundo donax TaxID=35708 RepID=A0A0A9EWC4_ARUDO
MDSSPGTSTVANADTSNNAISDKAPAETDASKRPMGTKQVKELLWRQQGESCVQSLDHLWGKKKETDAEK